MVTEDYVLIQKFAGVNVEQTSPTTLNEATSATPTKFPTSLSSKKRKATNLDVAEAIKEFSWTIKEENWILKKRNEITKKSQLHLYNDENFFDDLMKLCLDEETRMAGIASLLKILPRRGQSLVIQVKSMCGSVLIFLDAIYNSYLRSWSMLWASLTW